MAEPKAWQKMCKISLEHLIQENYQRLLESYQRDKGANTKDSHKPKVGLFEPKRKTAM